jgi:uncharacterized protein (DUF433 family)
VRSPPARAPHDDQDSTVLIDPTIRFGRPDVGGISTEVIWEHSEDGEDDDEIAEVYGHAARRGLGARVREATTGTAEAAGRVSRAKPAVVRSYLDADVLGLPTPSLGGAATRRTQRPWRASQFAYTSRKTVAGPRVPPAPD